MAPLQLPGHCAIPAAAAAGLPGSLAHLFSPGTALPGMRSPMLPSPLLAALGRTTAGLPGMLSPLHPPGMCTDGQRPASAASSLQLRVATALKGSAAAAAAGAQGGSAAGAAVSAMVPLVHPCALAPDLAPVVHRRQGLELLPILPLQGGMFQFQMQQQAVAARLAMVGESAGMAPLGGSPPAGAGQGHGCIPEVVFKLPGPNGAGHGPVSSASSRGRAAGAAGGPVPQGRAAGIADSAPDMGQAESPHGPGPVGEAPAGSLTAQIARKIREVEGKVRQVEERWGPLSLKTAQAHFLLHRACMHPQAAATFQETAAQTLQW